MIMKENSHGGSSKGMIVGMGVDIIEVERIQRLTQKKPKFLQRIFTPHEINYCQGKKNKSQHLAARFAAKEAFFKAWGKKIKWTDVWVFNLPSGKPCLKVENSHNYSFQKCSVSLSHLEKYAVAVVILEK